MPAATNKTCQMCRIEKPLAEFHHNRTKADKHNGICMACQKKVNDREKE